MRALIVAAVSTGAQATDDKSSIADQLRICREVCVARRWHIAAEVVIPGHSRNYAWLDEIMADSPDYRQLVALIRQHATDLIVVRDYDRLWRTDALRAQVMAVCRENRVQVYAINQPVEPADPTHLEAANDSTMILEALSGVISEQENRTRTRRMMAGRRARVERRGLPSYGVYTCPYGYRIVDGQIEPDPVTAPVVRRIFEQRVGDRASARSIAVDLQTAGIAVPRSAARWNGAQVYNILRNPIYVGHVRWGSVYNESGHHEPLIDADLWTTARAIDKLRSNASAGATPPNVLAGLIRCGYCDHAMSYTGDMTHGIRKALRCSYYMATRGAECDSNYHSARRVEAYVLAEVRAALADSGAWRQARERSIDSGQELRDLTDALGELDRRWQQWNHAYEIGAIGIDEMLMHRERIRGERDAVTERQRLLADTAALDAAMNATWQEMAPLLGQLDQLPPPELRHVYVSLIREIRLTRGQSPLIEWM